MAGPPEDAAVDVASRSLDRVPDPVELLVDAALHPLCHPGVAHAADLVAGAVEAVLNCLLQEDVTCKQGYPSEAQPRSQTQAGQTDSIGNREAVRHVPTPKLARRQMAAKLQ